MICDWSHYSVSLSLSSPSLCFCLSLCLPPPPHFSLFLVHKTGVCMFVGISVCLGMGLGELKALSADIICMKSVWVSPFNFLLGFCFQYILWKQCWKLLAVVQENTSRKAGMCKLMTTSLLFRKRDFLMQHFQFHSLCFPLRHTPSG